MTEPANEMEYYKMNAPLIQGVRIDKQWSNYLQKEGGFSEVSIGDYYLIGNDGGIYHAKRKV